MWLKALVIILLFYFFALLQNSFLPHFNIFGAVPNLVFILFFLLMFFSVRGGPSPKADAPREQALGWQNIFYAIAAGFFLDIFSFSYFGASIAILFLMAFLIKKIINSLKNLSIVFFIPLFLVFFTAYEIIFRLYLSANFGRNFYIEIVYNLAFAILGFYIYKKILKLK